MNNLHNAVNLTVIGKEQAGGFSASLVRAQRGKADVIYGVHVHPTQWSTSGLQQTDFLVYLGFDRQPCQFEPPECYARDVGQDFDLAGFVAVLPRCYQSLSESDRQLASCGILLPHPEGIGYFYGNASGESRRIPTSPYGDGHTATQHNRLQQSEDANFQYVLTFIESGSDRGWVTHYHSKSEVLSAEMEWALGFLSLSTFPECPEFEFEPCRWRFNAYADAPNVQGFNMGAETVHGQFAAHAQQFSPALEALIRANTEAASFGMEIQNPTRRRRGMIW